MKPLILINFKNYREAQGEKAVKLAKELSKVKKNKYEIALAPTLLTLREMAKSSRLPIYAQHADSILSGAHTGKISLQELKESKVEGVMLNHSERKISLSALQETIRLCKKSKMKTIVCASSLPETKEVIKLHPDYLAFEPKELIGGKVSVTQAEPQVIQSVVKLVRRLSPKTKVLCGAGVHTKEDIAHALLLGTEGVLIGHAVPKAKSPRKFLERMLG